MFWWKLCIQRGEYFKEWSAASQRTQILILHWHAQWLLSFRQKKLPCHWPFQRYSPKLQRTKSTKCLGEHFSWSGSVLLVPGIWELLIGCCLSWPALFVQTVKGKKEKPIFSGACQCKETICSFCWLPRRFSDLRKILCLRKKH